MLAGMKSTDQPADTDPADELAAALIRTLKTLQAVRHTMPRHHPAVDPLSYPVLFALCGGPSRVGDLAGALHSDISTVSRQASSLSAHGLIDKGPDPDDGRAQLLSLSPEGSDLLERARRARARMFAELLREWDGEDVTRFTTYLDLLSDTLRDQHLSPLTQEETP